MTCAGSILCFALEAWCWYLCFQNTCRGVSVLLFCYFFWLFLGCLLNFTISSPGGEFRTVNSPTQCLNTTPLTINVCTPQKLNVNTRNEIGDGNETVVAPSSCSSPISSLIDKYSRLCLQNSSPTISLPTTLSTTSRRRKPEANTKTYS